MVFHRDLYWFLSFFLSISNDLSNLPKLLSFLLSADNANVYVENGDFTNLSKTVNKELKNVKTGIDCN